MKAKKQPSAAAVAAGKAVVEQILQPNMSERMKAARETVKRALDGDPIEHFREKAQRTLPPWSLINEATDRVREAHLALAGLSDLLAGNAETDSERIYYLIRPIESELSAAFECLHTATEMPACKT